MNENDLGERLLKAFKDANYRVGGASIIVNMSMVKFREEFKKYHGIFPSQYYKTKIKNTNATTH